MNKEMFLKRLHELDLNKQEFSQISNVSYSTVTNWGVLRDGKPMIIPNWVEPFLNYYEKAKKFDYLKNEICKKIGWVEGLF